MTDLKETLITQIRTRREAMGLSRQQLAEAVGFHDATSVRYWEIGRNLPGAYALEKLADVFECSVDELLGRK